jgi:hypothetical protein
MLITSWKVRAGMPAALVLFLLAGPTFAQSVIAPPLTKGGEPVAPPPRGGAGGGGGGGGGGGANQAPVISSISAVQVAGRKFRIYGKVTDDTPATCGVVLSGAASGVVLCDASGNFDGIFDVETPGAATAVAGDGQLNSAPVNLMLGNAAPTITVRAVHGANDTVTFSGTVGDEVPAGLVVTLAGGPGVAGTSAIVLADGTWSVPVTLASGATGTVTATVTDWYGLTGSASTTY